MKFDKKFGGMLLAAATMVATPGANAAIGALSASANGYGLGLGLGVPLIGLNIPFTTLPSGVAIDSPAPDSASGSVVSVDLSAIGVPDSLLDNISVSVNAINGYAESNVDGLAGVRYAEASGGIVDLGVEIGVNVLGTSLSLALTDLTLASDARVDFDGVGLSTSGGATITSGSLTYDFGTLGDGSLTFDVAAGPNTGIDLGIISLFLNEQNVNEACAPGDDSCASMEVNALRVSVNVPTLLFADIIIGHSYAEMQTGTAPVPVPASVWMFGSALLGLVGFGRRRIAA